MDRMGKSFEAIGMAFLVLFCMVLEVIWFAIALPLSIACLPCVLVAWLIDEDNVDFDDDFLAVFYCMPFVFVFAAMGGWGS